MNESHLVAVDDVRTLTRVAGLSLGDDRLEHVAGLLNAWLPAANTLSRKMSAPELSALMPITVIAHPATTDSTE